MFDWTPSVGSTLLFLTGWSCGWFLLWRRPGLPRPTPARRRRRAVVVPARNEARSLPNLLASLMPALAPGDELVVVDDHSADGTSRIAAAAGARVVTAPDLPDGWTGKAWACATGAEATEAELLAFLDADVLLDAPDVLDRLDALVDGDEVLASVQPWHRTERPYEQLSLLFNITALMGSAAFTPLGERVRAGMAYGPVLACTRDGYRRAGGHAHPSVRGAVTEDIALAQRFPALRLHAGRGAVSFRMYPDGLRSLVQGWTKNIATGAAHVGWWCSLLVIGWIWSLAGGWLASPWFYLGSLVQIVGLGRRVGRFRVLACAAYPALLVVFLTIFLRSVLLTALGRRVTWKDRAVATRSRRG